MTLVTRLSTFFLTALAVVLAGFSLALYLLARSYLFGQADERLAAALDTLAAAVETEPPGLEWEPADRHLVLGRDHGPAEPRWEVRDVFGRFVDRSANLAGAELFPPTADARRPDDVPPGVRPFVLDGADARIARRVLWPTGGPSGQAPLPSEGPGPRRHPGLVLTAAVSLAPAQATLRALALTLVGLSAGVWLTAALLGHGLCRRALAPVAAMAAAAQDMGAADLTRRLPGTPTADELGELHRAFNGLLDRVQQAYERQRDFTGNASHQLRTPLTALLGQLDLALRRDRPAEEYRRVLGAARDQAGRLRQVVEALLFLARADAEADPGPLEPMDLAAWLPEHLRGWASHPRGADLRVGKSPDGALPVRARPILLGQLLDNLLDNALKYSPAGTPVLVSAAQEGGAVTLAVEDAGGGIPPDELPHVFEPFYRSPVARQRGLAGAGLGLAVARRIATALGGSLRAASEPGRGSRFTLQLPRA